MATTEIGEESESFFFLFAPVFAEEGARVARALAETSGVEAINGLYTGLDGRLDKLSALLGPKAGSLWNLSDLENDWFRNYASANAMKDLFHRYPPGTLGRLIVADRRIGGGFVKNAFVRPDPIAELTRKHGPLAPANYAFQVLAWAENALSTTSSRGLFLYAVAGAPAVALALAAEQKAIPSVALTHSRIRNLYMLDPDYREAGGTLVSKKLERSSELLQDGARYIEIRSEAKSFVSEFRTQPEQPDYMAAFSTRFFPKAKRFVALVKPAILALRSSSDRWLFRRALFGLLCDVRAALQLRLIDWVAVPDSCDFVYFPLHVDPEASTMVYSPHLTDQLAVVSEIAKSLPAGVSLVVKEHLPMLGARPWRAYRDLAKIPGVLVVDPRLDGFDLIRACSAVVTITGTAGQEALLLGKPAVVLGPTPYGAASPSIFQSQHSSNTLSAALANCLQSEGPTEQDAVNYVSTILRISFPLQRGFIWGPKDAVDYTVSRKTLTNELLRFFAEANKDRDLRRS